MKSVSKTTQSAEVGSSLLVKASAGYLCEVFGYNSGPGKFIQVFDMKVLPVGSESPKIVFWADANANFYFISQTNVNFDNGIVISNSAELIQRTAPVEDCFFTAIYK